AAPLGFDISGGFFLRDTLNAELFGVPVESGGADGYFLRLALPLRFGDWSVAPSFLYGQGFWEDGDLYWFFGKPSVPAFFAAGISAAFREEQRLYFRYLFLDLDILGPSGTDLFASRFDGFAAAYRRNFRLGLFLLDAAAGWFFVGGGLDGSLNSGNQQYYLFPYLFYDADIDARLHAIFGVLEAEFRQGVFRLGLGIGAAQVLWGEIKAELHSKQKKQSYLGIPIFDGREEFYSRSVNPGGLGAAFLSIEGGIERIPLGRKQGAPALSLSVKKLFAVPWGYKKILDSGFINTDGGEDAQGSAGGGPGGGDLNIADILLSGLSLRCSIVR
ncbi:MAG: hypothetical protein LBK05_04350, partial [Treponema sp.]|nr:hypothetical protein [Treponema sp.]